MVKVNKLYCIEAEVNRVFEETAKAKGLKRSPIVSNLIDKWNKENKNIDDIEKEEKNSIDKIVEVVE